MTNVSNSRIASASSHKTNHSIVEYSTWVVLVLIWMELVLLSPSEQIGAKGGGASHHLQSRVNTYNEKKIFCLTCLVLKDPHKVANEFLSIELSSPLSDRLESLCKESVKNWLSSHGPVTSFVRLVFTCLGRLYTIFKPPRNIYA